MPTKLTPDWLTLPENINSPPPHVIVEAVTICPVKVKPDTDADVEMSADDREIAVAAPVIVSAASNLEAAVKTGPAPVRVTPLSDSTLTDPISPFAQLTKADDAVESVALPAATVTSCEMPATERM